MKPHVYPLDYGHEDSYWWFLGRRKIIADVINRFVGTRAGLKILDVGCGTGGIMNLLRAYGDVVGTDLSQEALRFCQARGHRRLIRAGAAKLPFLDKSFDFVCGFDILEHLDDDKGVLEEFRRICRDKGGVLVTVPAFDFLWSGEDYVSEHRRRYSRSQLAAVVRRSGLQISRISYMNMLLLPAVVAVILYNRMFRPRSLYESNLAPVPAWVNTLLSSVFAFESLMLRRLDLPVGSSILCLALKQI